jgi:hypothetical protein
MKLLLILILILTSCGTMTEQEWKKKQMLKADRKMFKKMWKARR